MIATSGNGCRFRICQILRGISFAFCQEIDILLAIVTKDRVR